MWAFLRAVGQFDAPSLAALAGAAVLLAALEAAQRHPALSSLKERLFLGLTLPILVYNAIYANASLRPPVINRGKVPSLKPEGLIRRIGPSRPVKL